MEEKKQKNVFDRIWSALASLRFAILIFAMIALTSIVGTVIEQGVEPAKNLKIITELVGPGMAESVYRALNAMGFMDMYHSWWFVLFLAMFAANLLICSLDRFPSIWRTVNEPFKPLLDDQFRMFPIKREVVVKGKVEAVQEQVKKAMKGLGFKNINEIEGQLYSQTTPYSRLGVYITHASILVILAGAMIGIFFGFKAYINIGEGEISYMAFKQVAVSDKEMHEREAVWDAYAKNKGDMAATAQEFGVDAEHLKARMSKLGLIPFGFGVMCEDFELEFYGKSDMPKAYKSTLSVMDNGKKTLTKDIVVNDPLKYNGIYFYQSNYGMNPDTRKVKFFLRVGSESGHSEEIVVTTGDSFTIPGTNIKAVVSDFSPSLSFDQNGNATTYNEEMMTNPAIKLDVTDGAEQHSQWIVRRYPQTWQVGTASVQLADVFGIQYTGLQVRKDPGVLIVYFGCILMGAGLFIAFFMAHKRIWVRVRPDNKGAVSITVAASAHKYRESLETKIDRVLALMKDGGK